MAGVKVKITAVGAQIMGADGQTPRTVWQNTVLTVDAVTARNLVEAGAARETDEDERNAAAFEPVPVVHPQLQDELDEPVFDEDRPVGDDDQHGLDGMTGQALRAHAKKNGVKIPASITSVADIREHLRSEGL